MCSFALRLGSNMIQVNLLTMSEYKLRIREKRVVYNMNLKYLTLVNEISKILTTSSMKEGLRSCELLNCIAYALFRLELAN